MVGTVTISNAYETLEVDVSSFNTEAFSDGMRIRFRDTWSSIHSDDHSPNEKQLLDFLRSKSSIGFKLEFKHLNDCMFRTTALLFFEGQRKSEDVDGTEFVFRTKPQVIVLGSK